MRDQEPAEHVPWKAEVHLTPELVAEILRRQFPSLDAGSVEYLSEGWDSFAFLADGRWVFLFPKRQERERLLLSSMRLLSELCRRGLPLSIPCPCHWGQASDGFPFRFVGYELLNGGRGDKTGMPPHRRLSNADLMGKALAALHGFPPDQAIALALPDRRGIDHAHVLLAEARHLATRLKERVPPELMGGCEPFLNGTVALPPPPWELRLTHGDLQAEHILLDDSGAISGVIDFGDACIGDPLVDFVGLCAWQGWDFTKAALEAAGRRIDEPTRQRVAFMACCLALINLGWADWERDRPANFAMLRHALGAVRSCR